MHISQKSTVTKLLAAKENPPKIIVLFLVARKGCQKIRKKFLIFDSISWPPKIRNYLFSAGQRLATENRLFSALLTVENKAYFFMEKILSKISYFQRHLTAENWSFL
jgi:hypothetical protein